MQSPPNRQRPHQPLRLLSCPVLSGLGDRDRDLDLDLDLDLDRERLHGLWRPCSPFPLPFRVLLGLLPRPPASPSSGRLVGRFVYIPLYIEPPGLARPSQRFRGLPPRVLAAALSRSRSSCGPSWRGVPGLDESSSVSAWAGASENTRPIERDPTEPGPGCGGTCPAAEAGPLPPRSGLDPVPDTDPPAMRSRRMDLLRGGPMLFRRLPCLVMATTSPGGGGVLDKSAASGESCPSSQACGGG